MIQKIKLNGTGLLSNRIEDLLENVELLTEMMSKTIPSSFNNKLELVKENINAFNELKYCIDSEKVIAIKDISLIINSLENLETKMNTESALRFQFFPVLESLKKVTNEDVKKEFMQDGALIYEGQSTKEKGDYSASFFFKKKDGSCK